MVYFDSWDEFAKAVEQLYFAEPNKFRFVIKYRHCDGKVVIKGTDDNMCLKYRTEQQQDLKKFEKLNSVLMRHMASR
ncbi:signal recognition particle 9 kDa protein [Exaiptasia diaphana]|uniref:Signal recognition particle 9 kDa protein n=1 Tax=Exaiptasia diaphana TaxID=2652724 RepID=A0A913WVN6_EXADI|nr:signal recognition particle 9 kDa protein [Exaiptasia diaphana]